jgi:hypothetical protein
MHGDVRGSTPIVARGISRPFHEARARAPSMHSQKSAVDRRQNSESIVYEKDQLGHHSIKVTVDVYGHLVPGANKAAVDRLD